MGVSLLDSPAMRLFLILVVFAGCSDHKKQEGLPPAQEWGAEPGGMTEGTTSPHAISPHGANPHAGLDMNDPNGDGTDPHAGVDMSGGGTDVAKLGLPAPDPNRPIDPTHHVKGVIVVAANAKDHVKPGTAVFVIIKQADATGKPSGPPLAVEKMTWQGDKLPFEMTEAQAMIGGTQLTGDVIVLARYDQDGDAISKQPGDITGQLRVTVPADNVKLTLDTILP